MRINQSDLKLQNMGVMYVSIMNNRGQECPDANFWKGNCYFPHGETIPAGPGPHNYRSFTFTLRHTTLCKTPLDEWSARCRDVYVSAHNTHNRGPPWPRRIANFQCQQARDSRPTSWTSRPQLSAGTCFTDRCLLWFSSASLNNCRYTTLKYARVTAARYTCTWCACYNCLLCVYMMRVLQLLAIRVHDARVTAARYTCTRCACYSCSLYVYTMRVLQLLAIRVHDRFPVSLAPV
jgi:hypothetical protein